MRRVFAGVLSFFLAILLRALLVYWAFHALGFSVGFGESLIILILVLIPFGFDQSIYHAVSRPRRATRF